MEEEIKEYSNIEFGKVIKENKYYRLVIGHSTGVSKLPIYQIVNKEFNIIEQEFFIYPQALVNHDQLEKLLDDYYSTTRVPGDIVRPIFGAKSGASNDDIKDGER